MAPIIQSLPCMIRSRAVAAPLRVSLRNMREPAGRTTHICTRVGLVEAGRVPIKFGDITHACYLSDGRFKRASWMAKRTYMVSSGIDGQRIPKLMWDGNGSRSTFQGSPSL